MARRTSIGIRQRAQVHDSSLALGLDPTTRTFVAPEPHAASGSASFDAARFLRRPVPREVSVFSYGGRCPMRVSTFSLLLAFSLAPLLGSCDGVRDPAQPGPRRLAADALAS